MTDKAVRCNPRRRRKKQHRKDVASKHHLTVVDAFLKGTLKLALACPH